MNSAFPLPLIIEDTGDGCHYVSRSPFRWEHGPFVVHIESNRVTDFASIPRIFWRVCPPMGVHNRAAFVHDELYTSGCVSRRMADACFHQALLDCGANAVMACIMWAAVRLCGRCHYRRLT